jgi:hypothetical protein
MRKYDAILATDQISRKKTVMARAALENMVRRLNEKPLPSYLQHDRRRPIGFVNNGRLDESGGVVRVLGTFNVFDSREEMEQHASLFEITGRTGLLRFETERGELKLEGIRLEVDGFEVFLGTGLLDEVFPQLPDLCDADGLFPMSAMPKPDWYGFESSGHFLFYSRFLRRGFFLHNNFNEEFLQALLSASKEHPEWDARVALDRDLVGLRKLSTGIPMEMDYWYGPKFNGSFDQLADGVTVHGMPEHRDVMLQIQRTEFQVASRDNLRTIKIEEVSTADNQVEVGNDVFVGCRSAHGIFDRNQNVFIHLDGAVRLYSVGQHAQRLQMNIKEFGKAATQVKTFLLNGRIDVSSWLRLTHFHFRNNPLVDEFFGIEAEEDLDLRVAETGAPCAKGAQ